jgi:hypothetical protein
VEQEEVDVTNLLIDDNTDPDILERITTSKTTVETTQVPVPEAEAAD